MLSSSQFPKPWGGGDGRKVGSKYSVKDIIESNFALWIPLMKKISLFVGSDQ